MQTTFALAALAAVAYAAPQGVTTDIPAPGYPPAGAATSYTGQFEITVVNGTVSKRDLAKVCVLDNDLLYQYANLTSVNLLADKTVTLQSRLPMVSSPMRRAERDILPPTTNSNSMLHPRLVPSTPVVSPSSPMAPSLSALRLSSMNA